MTAAGSYIWFSFLFHNSRTVWATDSTLYKMVACDVPEKLMCQNVPTKIKIHNGRRPFEFESVDPPVHQVNAQHCPGVEVKGSTIDCSHGHPNGMPGELSIGRCTKWIWFNRVGLTSAIVDYSLRHLSYPRTLYIWRLPSSVRMAAILLVLGYGFGFGSGFC